MHNTDHMTPTERIRQEMIDNLIPVAFVIEADETSTNRVEFRRMVGDYEGIRWAAFRGGSVLGSDGYWVLDTQPSSRNEEYYKRFRFMTLQDAYEAYQKSIQLDQE